MADEGDERGNMDLNLYLGLPLSPLPQIPDLGSDLALGSASSPPLTADMADAHTPYSPSRSSFFPDPMVREGDDNYGPNSPENNQHRDDDGDDGDGDGDGNPYLFFSSAYDFASRSLPPQVDVFEEAEASRAHVRHTPPSLGGFHNRRVTRTIDDDDDDDDVNEPYVLYRPRRREVEPPYQPVVLTPSEIADSQDVSHGGSSSQQDVFQSSEYNFTSFIELQRRIHGRNSREIRRFRSSLPHRNRSRVNDAAASFPTSAQNLHESLLEMPSERPLETSGKNKANDERINNDGLEEKEEKAPNAVNFDCNICFDLANEPVVTSCGHLFCWPCLYQWMYHYSEHKECPSCKGQVTETNIIPIYGRGTSEVEAKFSDANGDPILKIPPRPHGRRFDSLRQRIQRPISRRPGEGISDHFRRFMGDEFINMGRLEGLMDPSLSVILGRLGEGVSNSRRNNDFDEGLQSGIRTEGHMQLHHPTMQHFLEHRNRAVANRYSPYRSRRTHVTDVHPSGRISPIVSSTILSPQEAVINQDSVRNDRSSSLSTNHSLMIAPEERLDALRADLSMLVTTFAHNDGIHSLDPQNREIIPSGLPNSQNLEALNFVPRTTGRTTYSADQASASSTMATIQDDVATDTSAEPIRVGSSSRSSRRRARSNASSTFFDIDGVLHTNKRRRLN